MKCLEEVNLRDLGLMTKEEIRSVGIQALAAVVYLHKCQNIVHSVSTRP